MFNIKIMVLDTRTNKEEKPTQYNTFWDDGKLEGVQNFFKLVYRIEASESEEE
jgi:hypothetical protein